MGFYHRGMAKLAQDVGRVPCQRFKVVTSHSTDAALRSVMCTSILTIYFLSSLTVVALGVCPSKRKWLFFS